MPAGKNSSPPPDWYTAIVGRGSLFRNSIAGGVATAADFAFVTGIVGAGLASVPVATFFGCALGAITNFSINRYWTFQSRGPYAQQIGRYLAVSATSAVLNSAVVAALLAVVHFPYQLIWVAARALVFAGVNYPLHRYYVFAPATDARRS